MNRTPLDIDARLAVLNGIEAVYDDFAGALETACRKRCADCCTGNVTMTTLEGYRVVASLSDDRLGDMRQRLAAAGDRNRFRPQLTVNAIAERCMQGREIPEETVDPSWGSCPLLDRELCTVYGVRPMGCRCFVSRQPCRLLGSADVEDRVLTVNHVFLQIVEHLDAEGCSGNLNDVLQVMAENDGRRQYLRGTLRCGRHGLIANRPAPALMIPPKHRKDLAPILTALRDCFPK